MKLDGILETTREELLADEVDASEELTVNVEMLGVLMNNLSNLYSDPKTGAFRETLSNAIDSHVNLAHNEKDFVNVVLPVEGNNDEIIISDKGVGMSRETLVKNFLSYGSSTKSKSNNETGGFGYGGKSPLAVSNMFHVVSVKDGLRNSFTVTKNTEDTLIPPKFLWDEDCREQPVATDEDDGVTVSYRVPPTRVRESYREVNKSWTPDEISLLGVPFNTVKVDGMVVSKTVHNPELFEPVKYSGETIGWICKSDEFTLNEKNVNSNVYVHIGNVIYHVDNATLYNESRLSALRNWNVPTVLNVPNGLLDMTPSRDELRYTPRTVETLKTVISQFIVSVEAGVQTAVNRSENMAEALTVFAEHHAKNFPWSQENRVVFRDFGEILPALLNLSQALGKSLTDKAPSITNYWSAPQRNGRVKSQQNSYSRDTKWDRIMHQINNYPVYVSSENTSSTGGRVRRNWELLKTFGSQSKKHELEVLNRNVLIVDEAFVKMNAWTEALFGSSENLETALADARKARTAYNKKHGITGQKRAANGSGKRVNKIAFVTIEVDKNDSTKYALTPYKNLTDANSLGEHYIETVRDYDYPRFSISDFSENSISGSMSDLRDSLTLTVLYAQSVGRKVVLRTSRQASVSFKDTVTVSRSEFDQFVKDNATPPPTMTEKEVQARVIYGDNVSNSVFSDSSYTRIYRGMTIYSHETYRLNSFRKNVSRVIEFAEKNNVCLPADLQAYCEISDSAEQVISESALTQWINYREGDIFTRHVYSYTYVNEPDYLRDYSDNVKTVINKTVALRNKYELLFLATGLLPEEELMEYETESEAHTELLIRQIVAIIDAVKE